MKIIRYKKNGGDIRWGIVENNEVKEIVCDDSVETLHSLMQSGNIKTADTFSYDSLSLLPPTSSRASVYCAGLNYRDHAREVKMPLPQNPIFFTKPSSSLCGARDDIVYPKSVRLLDYEVELAVVIAKKIGKRDEVREDNLADYLLGIAIFNDVSARDVQLSRGQWFLGKSFRTFAPLGPIVQTMDAEVAKRLYALNLELSVIDAQGQNPHAKDQRSNTSEMVFPVHRLIEVLKEWMDLYPGDVIATGTPHGVALRSPSKLQTRIAEIFGIAPAKRIASFLEAEKKTNFRYLEVGDTVTVRIASADGVVDLGAQRCRVVPEEGISE